MADGKEKRREKDSYILLGDMVFQFLQKVEAEETFFQISRSHTG
jgi:hypothetical protein